VVLLPVDPEALPASNTTRTLLEHEKKTILSVLVAYTRDFKAKQAYLQTAFYASGITNVRSWGNYQLFFIVF